MIAVYYNEAAGPYKIYVLDVPNAEHHDFLKSLELSGYPFPSADVVFIENDKVVDSWHPLKDIP